MDSKTALYRRIRGAILKLLAEEYPRPSDSKVIFVQLLSLGYIVKPEECEGYISYLAERAYVKAEERKGGGIGITTVAITADGLDLLDRLSEDPGVDVDF